MGNQQQKLGGYYIETDIRKVLGIGVFGTVMPGVRISDKLRVAAKKVVIEKEFTNENTAEDEATILTEQLKPHEHIVKAYDFIMEDVMDKGTPFVHMWLIMELCPLGNLKSYAYERELDLGKKVDIMHQCSLALRHLHGNKPSITHRDLKPENILVSGTPDSPIIKLGDFGMAKTVDKIHGRYVTMRTFSGTLNYMAPELYVMLVEEQPRYDRSIDLFSLGLCFLALLEASKGSQMTAWRGENNKSLGRVMWEKRKTGYVVQLHGPGDGTHVKAVKTIIGDMLRASPCDRPQASEVVARLAKLRPEVCGKSELNTTGYGLAQAMCPGKVAVPK